MSPTLIASYAVYSAGIDNTTLVTPSFTPSNGEVIVVKGTTWDLANGLATPTGGSQTYTLQSTPAAGGFYAWAGIWTAAISGSPGSMAVSVAPATASNTRHSIVVERWGNAKLAATPATSSPVKGTTSPNLCSATITTVGTNSIVTWCAEDENSVDPTGHTYDQSTGAVTEDGFYDGHIGSNTVAYYAYQTAATAGVQNIGISVPSAIKWVMVGVEVQSSGITDPTALATGATISPAGTKATTGIAATAAGAAVRLSGVKNSPGPAAEPLGATAAARGVKAGLGLISQPGGATMAAAGTKAVVAGCCMAVGPVLRPGGAKAVIRAVTLSAATGLTAALPNTARIVVVRYGTPQLRWTFGEPQTRWTFTLLP